MGANRQRKSARDRAVAALEATYDGQGSGLALLAEWQADDPLNDADAALVAELVVGVARHRLTCEHVAAHFYDGRWEGLPIRWRVILAVAVYQLCYLERIPDHAIVDQAVRQAGKPGKPPTGMVNAVLRAVARARGEIVPWTEDVDRRRCVPMDVSRGRLFSENVLPDPQRRPLEYLVAASSHPPWLVERWHRRFKPALCRQMCWAGMGRPPLTLRPNLMRITAEDLAARLQGDNVIAERIADSEAVVIRSPAAITEMSVFRDGLCQPQDVTAQAALSLAPPRPGELVLDLCAGVGTKSTQAAELMGNKGVVFATDIDESKLARIDENARRLGLSIIRPVSIEQIEAAIAREGRPPDLIVVDAPCTNTGVLARRPEARYRASQKSLVELVGRQHAILLRADELAGPTTRILYSTCSVEREENEDQVAEFCQGTGRWRVARQAASLPDSSRDGGYAAELLRA